MRITRQQVYWGTFWMIAIAVSATALVSAFNPQPDPPGHFFGLMTVEVNHDISIHVANTKMVADRKQRNDCVAQLELVNACGQTVARTSGRIAPTESLSLNFTVPRPDALPPGPCSQMRDLDFDRMRLRAQVTFDGASEHCISSVEVGEPFGRNAVIGSGFLHPGLIVGFNPQPEPPGDKVALERR